VEGEAGITTDDDEGETHPAEFVTVKVYVPSDIFETVVFVPVPDTVIFPGILVSVHEPDEGSPLKTTDPVGEAHVGEVIVPGIGAAGGEGCGFITTFPDKTEVHPIEFVTLKV
jgi:hypothetical protein